MSTGNNEPDDSLSNETDFDKELQALTEGTFESGPTDPASEHRGLGFDAQHDPALTIDADVLNASHPIDPDLRERAMKAVRAPLPHPYYVSAHERNVFVRLYRWFRDLRRR